ncbi:carboxypeptidase-like regulatory domain-containing protein [Geofilum rubicundum]|uniref:TolB protein n=1 Tax=Geofilum rubicundum JCM 15548 TaxID=1236989 RepID=A0A0E9LXS6_9BACT|nr:carboxypeptidase-like regulatory domain-containing protein [Geofilum rubicundum]GAO30108.1 hypothetical protein JCM15548_12360 [Geofilum rubicundum JCM 15548]
MKLHHIIPAILLSLALFACEEHVDNLLTGSLSGVVLLQSDYSPLSEVRISTHPYTENVTTDENGRFVIEKIPTGEYNVIATKAGYKSQSITITIAHNKETDVEMELIRSLTSDNAPEFSEAYAPLNNATLPTVHAEFQWQTTKRNDSVWYKLLIYESGSSNNPLSYENLTDTFLVVNNLKFKTWYYWQVYAENDAGQTFSEIRQFRTMAFPSNKILYAAQAEESNQLFIADSTGANPVQITNNQHHIWNARINKQKTKIAFQSSRDMTPYLYIMDLDGSNVKKLTTFQIGGYFHHKIEYDWAPNGSYIMFSSFNKLYRIDPDGTGLIAIASAPEGKHFREVIYQPNGSGLVTILTGNTMKDRQIYTLNTNGSNLQLLYDNNQYAIQGLAMHPDNNRLLFSMDMSGNESETGRMLDARIMELDISSGVVTDRSTLKDNGTNDLEAMYSPDGGKIIFTNGLNTATATPAIWIMTQDGRYRNNILPGAFNPYWFE